MAKSISPVPLLRSSRLNVVILLFSANLILFSHRSKVFPISIPDDLNAQNVTLVEKNPVELYFTNYFLYGYMSSALIAGILSNKIGSKWLIGLSVFGSSSAFMATPFIEQLTGNKLYLIGLRFILGLFQGLALPSILTMAAFWFPKKERTCLMGVVLFGVQLGSIVLTETSSNDSAWLSQIPIVTYIFSAIGFAWFFVWSLFAHSTVEGDTLISKEEYYYINDQIQFKPDDEVTKFIPWKHIFLSGSAWLLIFIHCLATFSNYIIIGLLPNLLKKLFTIPHSITQFIPFIALFILFLFMLIFGFLADFFIAKKMMSTTNCRKIWVLLAFTGTASLLVGISFLKEDNGYLAFLFFMIGLGLSGLQYTSIITSYLDIASTFGGIVFGIGESICCLILICTPFLIKLLALNGTRKEWNRVFWIVGGTLCFGALVFTLLFDGHIKSWAYTSTKKMKTKKKENTEKKLSLITEEETENI